MTRIAIIIGSTRPRRRAALVAGWVAEVATAHVADRADVTFEVVDLADYGLPLLDEPVPAAIGDYHHRHTQHLRLVMAEVKVADVRSQLALSLFTDFEITDMTQPGIFTPGAHHEPILIRLLEEVLTWSRALKPLRVATETGTATAVQAAQP